MITFKHKGDFQKSRKFLDKILKRDRYSRLKELGERGVQALMQVTPVDTGVTASSWGYEILQTPEKTSIVWTNSNMVAGVPLVILLQYGHVTGTGGYVKGVDFINPAIKPIFDQIEKEVWKEVTES